MRHLKRKGYLRPGNYSWKWTRNGEPSGSVGVTIELEKLVLNYRWTPSGGEPIEKRTSFWLRQSNCHFSGARDWLVCPWCARRCAIVYGLSGDGYFACRRCLKLGYSSESEDLMGRLWRKQHNLEAKLRDGYLKPKWMRMRTYERIWTQIDVIEERKDSKRVTVAPGMMI